MSLPMVHLGVGKKIIDPGFEIKNLSQFYLGLISPDAIHMRKNADRLAKKITHLGRSSSDSINWDDEIPDKRVFPAFIEQPQFFGRFA